ncbi:unnamed protein product [Menidia menidia]|uniref:(Atlantic silverside) hypothetical protein n=1 Tax=Menidia menidia TaxID=238744 RepID=A0A8S4AGZ9_9TELE|nr:unnamed protein product [Menidia menidia]
MSSSGYGCRYISWCVDTAELPASATATPTESSTGRENTTITSQCSQAIHKGRNNYCVWKQQPSDAVQKAEKVTDFHINEGEDDDSILKGREGHPKLLEAEASNRQETSTKQLNDGKVLLPRSSPVISKRHRPRSWHVGGNNPSNPPRLDSTPPSSCSLSPGHHGGQTATSMEDLRSKWSSGQSSFPAQVDEKQQRVSFASNLDDLQSDHILPRVGQHRLAKQHRNRSQSNCVTTHKTEPNKKRSCSANPDFPADIFKTSCELEKENAHFIVVDMVLEVLEGAKWTLSSDQWTSVTDPHEHKQCQNRSQAEEGKLTCDTHTDAQGSCTADTTQMTSNKDTHRHYSCGNQHTQSRDDEESGNEEAAHPIKTFSVLSTDSGFEDSGPDTTLMPTESLTDADWLARQLVLEFKKRWLPSHWPGRGRQSLRSSLQELPGTGVMAVSSCHLAEEIRLRTRMRGSLNWAPPRFQIIFTVQPTHRRSEVVALQNFLCAGCGTAVEPRYIKKLRYCEYLGRYFCDCCHSGSEAVIPGRVLSSWDFSKYSVSDFSKQLLESVWHQPLFDLTCVGRTLCGKVKELDKFRELQEQLIGIRKLLDICRLSERALAEFEHLPAHLVEQPLLFSLDDLLRVKKGQLVPQLRLVLHSATDHVQTCQLCLARGFLCEICREKDVIFPFQSNLCKRCKVCKTCFHKHCFAEKRCPKCARILSRTKVHPHP